MQTRIYVESHEFSDHMILSSELRDHMIVQACSAAFEGGAQAVAAWLDEGGSVDARCAEQDERPFSCAEIGDVTLLIAAAFGGQEAMVRMLLQRGASVNLQDSLGRTALMCTAADGHTTIVQALLDAKADAAQQASDGNTALMIAEHHEHTVTAQLLRQHANRQAAVKEAAVMHAAATAKLNLSGRRVRIFDLDSKP